MIQKPRKKTNRCIIQYIYRYRLFQLTDHVAHTHTSHHTFQRDISVTVSSHKENIVDLRAMMKLLLPLALFFLTSVEGNLRGDLSHDDQRGLKKCKGGSKFISLILVVAAAALKRERKGSHLACSLLSSRSTPSLQTAIQ
jgi:hypothetical protein